MLSVNLKEKKLSDFLVIFKYVLKRSDKVSKCRNKTRARLCFMIESDCYNHIYFYFLQSILYSIYNLTNTIRGIPNIDQYVKKYVVNLNLLLIYRAKKTFELYSGQKL